jgi:NADH:ubiquinone oxidoreductase subunit 5 (subunit L)/multisubunit Na+/H+ antiporter MnhA subunit
MPVTAVLFLVATVAICAMPPLNGFVGEFLIYLGMFDSVRWGVNVLPAAAGLIGLSLIGGFVVLAFSKLYSTVFLGTPRHHHVAESREVDNTRIVAMAIPVIAILCIGILPQYSVVVIERVALQFMPSAEPVLAGYITPTLFHISLVALMLILLTALLYVLKQRAQRKRTIAEGPTWGCGFTSPNGRMQYTGESFAEGVESIATSITQQMVEGKTVGKSEIFPSRHNYGVRHKDKIDSLFTAWWVEMLRQINKRIMSLRTGKINHYILFALLFLVAVFVLSLLNII